MVDAASATIPLANTLKGEIFLTSEGIRRRRQTDATSLIGVAIFWSAARLWLTNRNGGSKGGTIGRLHRSGLGDAASRDLSFRRRLCSDASAAGIGSARHPRCCQPAASAEARW